MSIVLFKTPVEDICNVLADLELARLPMTVTVIDNSPTSALRAVIEAKGATYIHVAENPGFGAGHNIALKQNLTKSPYHLILNADVRIPPNTLETLVLYMNDNPSVGLVMPKVLNIDGSEQLQARRLPTPLDLIARRFFRSTAPNWEERADTHAPVSIPFLCGCFMLLRGTALAKSGLFDERFFLYMEDADLSRRVGDVADTIYYPGARIYHERSRASYKNQHMLWNHLRSAIKYFNKWGWIWDQERYQRNRQAGSLITRSSHHDRIKFKLGSDV